VGDRELQQVMRRAVEAPVSAKPRSGTLLQLEAAPAPREHADRAAEAAGSRRRQPINYLEREARNASLGRAGEELVLAFERNRLDRAGQRNLARDVEHVSITQGDGAGFDIRSFEENGTERFIEVKSTAYGKETPFFVSRNEVDVSRRLHERYHLYRVFELRDQARLYTVAGSLSQAFELRPEIFRARVA
jgi:hypothetical protein